MDFNANIYWVMGNNETINNWKPCNKKRHLHDINIHWKGLVKGFRISNVGQKVAKIQVAHVYDYREMLKEKVFSQPNFPKIECNCEYA